MAIARMNPSHVTVTMTSDSAAAIVEVLKWAITIAEINTEKACEALRKYEFEGIKNTDPAHKLECSSITLNCDRRAKLFELLSAIERKY